MRKDTEPHCRSTPPTLAWLQEIHRGRRGIQSPVLAGQSQAIYLVPLFFDLLQLQQHCVHAMLVEITVLLQRSVFQLQIFHLLEVLVTASNER